VIWQASKETETVERGFYLRPRTAAVGLVDPREAEPSTALGPFIQRYLNTRVDLKPWTITMMKQTLRALVTYFGDQKPLADIHEGDAELWRLALIGKGLADATVRKRVAHAKQFFAATIRQRLISLGNPFR
jgi:site-specific recombinase XerD